LTESFKSQKIAQIDEESDLRDACYPEQFIIQMRVVKRKLLHARVIAFCWCVVLFLLVPSPANQVLIGIFVIYALAFRNYPMQTRAESGKSSPLLGCELYEEQDQYIKKGNHVALIYLAGSLVSLVAAFKVLLDKFGNEQAFRAAVLVKEFEWFTNTNQTHFRQRLGLAIAFLFSVAVGLLGAAAMRWYNIVSCRGQLKRHHLNFD
jgi:hypothetical protein